ncbi:hypothetical protein K493DRAFT_405371 [Basidiobolus meristosporus CBS 931.73]|uniref:MICOS complex subunit MIC60 n=1 Tax=Basidiobolus meristosporus CBS 931.73 TaxID=1314790 RepID=A0A1Y1YVK8_9FUNG|nr:hypothetical protein K493DRAFT_405371 [Basidiobolus meristosporus CBS 931.73]|eukprot:ORY02093.1 hypothetical protein K493DRAFT_405371 [Basidiobolus meristosporus CBS 931.73]
MFRGVQVSTQRSLASQATARTASRVHSSRILSFKKPYTTEATTNSTTTTAIPTAAPKKKRSLLKTISLLTVLGGAGYVGSGFYSLKDENFRKYFTEYVPGAKDFVTEIESEKDPLGRLQLEAKKLPEYGSNLYNTLLGYTSDAKKMIDDMRKNEEPQYGFPKESAPVTTHPEAKAISQTTFTPTSVVVDSEEEVTLRPPAEALSHAAEDAGEALRKIKHALFDVPEFESNDPSVNNVLKNVNNVLKSLNDETFTQENYVTLIQKAKEAIHDLQSYIATLKDSEKKALQDELEKQTKHFNEALAKQHDSAAQQLADLQAHMKERFLKEKNEIKKEYLGQLSKSLEKQAQDLERRWSRELQIRLDNERGGRLSNIDQIMARLRGLESICFDNDSYIERSARVNQMLCAVQALRTAIYQPHKTPFTDEVALVSKLGAQFPLISAVASSISLSVQEAGIDSLPDLLERFEAVSKEVRRASLIPEDGGFVSHLMSVFLSKLMFKKHGLVEGDDVESVLARVEYFLRENDLEQATREFNQLKGWPKNIAKDWIASARVHLEVKQALEVIECQAQLASLNMA